ncbi:MAG: aldose epimerase family protein [Pseudomonadota bacterium]
MANNIEHWGKTTDGHDVHRVALKREGMSAAMITYGASLQDLRIEGHNAPLVLGFDDIEAYENHGFYAGAIAGRCANRIANGQFKLAGKMHALAKVDGEAHQLHGGPNGFANRVWKIAEATDFKVVLELESSDGDMGYPGNLLARCCYSLTEIGALDIALEAQTDAPTICNLTNHAYFNLEDGGSGDVNLHRLQIGADEVCELDDGMAPTGELVEVSGSQYDFRALRPIGDFRAYDINFCLAEKRRALTDVARVVAPSSGVQMDVSTTEAGIQLFSALHLDGSIAGLDGIEYVSGGALCLEAQIWPDAINHSHFPSAILMPGQKLEQTTQYRFSLL